MIKPPAERDGVCVPNEASELYPLNAWADAGITLEVVDKRNMFVVFSNGVYLPIIAMWDEFGWPAEEWDDCRCYDFGNADIGYGRANASHNVVRQVI